MFLKTLSGKSRLKVKRGLLWANLHSWTDIVIFRYKSAGEAHDQQRPCAGLVRKEGVVGHYIVRLIVIIIFVGCCHPAGLGAELHLKLNNDTLVVKSGEERGSFPLSAIKDYDSLRVWDHASLIFYSGNDSLVVTKTATTVPLTIEGPSRTLHVFVWFCSSLDRFSQYVAIQRKFPAFGTTAPPNGATFGYSDTDDSNLVRLREKYHLEQVAGSGSEISRIINLMKWVHATIHHDGSSTNPSPRNALHILQVCADSSRGANCRMIATALNEVYLAVGLKSRHLTCMPEDKEDQDCHVIDMVWSDSLSKWVYMDPSFQAYFEDQNGVILSPQEVRKAFIKGDSLALNEDIDHNGEPHDPIQYKSYMAKNLFRFLVPLKSEFGYESLDGDVAWVYLNPVGYDSALVGQADTTTGQTSRHINFYTDNATWFWER